MTAGPLCSLLFISFPVSVSRSYVFLRSFAVPLPLNLPLSIILISVLSHSAASLLVGHREAPNTVVSAVMESTFTQVL